MENEQTYEELAVELREYEFERDFIYKGFNQKLQLKIIYIMSTIFTGSETLTPKTINATNNTIRGISINEP